VILRLTSTLTADIGDEVGDDASEGRGQRALHLHRFDYGEIFIALTTARRWPASTFWHSPVGRARLSPAPSA
jgi:hypothetical protein